MNSRPINIEFTGTPESGKTTQLAIISQQLQKEGYNVLTVQESAEVVPSCFEKASADANRWMTLKNINDILYANYSNADLIIIDRGFFDRTVWEKIYYTQKKISLLELITHILYFENFNLNPDLVFAFFTSPNISIKRRGGEGRLTTNSFVTLYNSILEENLKKYSGKYIKIDADQSFEIVSQQLLNGIHNIMS